MVLFTNSRQEHRGYLYYLSILIFLSGETQTQYHYINYFSTHLCSHVDALRRNKRTYYIPEPNSDHSGPLRHPPHPKELAK